jgi:beta-glucosidase
VSTGTRPEKELKDFARVNLQAGESKTVSFTVTPDKLEYYNLNLEKVIEPGNFDLMVGPNSEELKTVSFTVH